MRLMPKPWVVSPAYQGECRRSNGTGKLVWTIMVSSCGLVSAGLILWLLNLSGRTTTAEATLSSQAVTNAGRFSTLETMVRLIDVRQIDMNRKLDQLIDRGGANAKR